MSCNCKCKCPETIKVVDVVVTATEVQLQETQVVLADLPVGQIIDIVVDPELLPQSTLPVVLTDGTTTIPLWQENGNVMRETMFLPFCRRLARCKCGDLAHVVAKYLGDPAHFFVFRSKRY